jgi:hypothetical protein
MDACAAAWRRAGMSDSALLTMAAVAVVQSSSVDLHRPGDAAALADQLYELFLGQAQDPAVLAAAGRTWRGRWIIGFTNALLQRSATRKPTTVTWRP